LRYGAGVKGKINQSLAYGLPVVATPQAAEGMFLVDGESVLLASDPRSFADAAIRLYRDEQLWRRLSDQGIEVMKEHFSFDAAKRAMQQVVGQ
jgi:glycosyltransferase involved in cell wall biosynthesis